jgi:hypothetical protein
MERNDRRRGVPNLYYDHPGYWKVVLSLLIAHAALGIDALTRWDNAKTTAFDAFRHFIGPHLWTLGVIHILIDVAMVYGLYARGRFGFVRFGCAMSVVIFNISAAAFAVAAFQNHLSYYAAIASVALSLSSAAALYEPPVQAAWKDRSA